MALKDYLLARRAEIEAQMKALKNELAEIRIAETAIASNSPAPSPHLTTWLPTARVRQGTIKDWVLRVLAEFPDGLETDEVTEAVLKAGGPEVPRNSMTPQLSRLKSDGFITQVGRNWKILQPIETSEVAQEVALTPEQAFGRTPHPWPIPLWPAATPQKPDEEESF